MTAAGVALTLALAGARALEAQQLKGVVLLPDSSAGAQSVLVTASDARGLVIGRAVTGARGEFTLALSVAGSVTVRALRVGYHPTELPARELAPADTLTLRIVLNAEAVHLTAITVRRTDPCRARDDRRARVADVWEEARKALLLANTARSGGGLVAEWTRYDRVLDSLGQRILDQTLASERAPSEHPFRSLPAEALARDGYIVEDDAGISYYAPDADVLLSPSFAGTHCFQLVDGPPASQLIGVRFRPVDDALQRRDVEGTLWLDRTSSELRFLEFAYTGLPLAAAPAEAGGRVDFRRMADGAWLVTRWAIRMPALERVVPARTVGGRFRVVGPSIVLRGVKVVGGEVTQVERDGQVVYRAAGASLAVRVTPPPGVDPANVAGARVSLLGTDYDATADSAGIARFALVLPGRYRVVVTTPALGQDHDQPLRADVDVRGDTLHQLQMRLPSRRMDAAALGLAPRTQVRAAVDFGVADSLGRPVAGVELIAVDVAGKEYRLRSDTLGLALLDGVPLGEMRVEARLPGYYLAYGTVTVVEGRTRAKVLLERMPGGAVLDTVHIDAAADEKARFGAFEARRRAGSTTATITREQIERRNPVDAWQMLRNVSTVQLIVGPEGVLPISRRTSSMNLRSNNQPCAMRLAIDGVLLPDDPVNLSHRMPPPSDIHGIEVFAGPATIPIEYGGERGTLCGLIVVWTK